MKTAIERFEMQAKFEGLVQLLAKNLYSSPDAFVRELVQNAHDAIRLRAQRERGFGGRIAIESRPAERTLTFTDDGVGMSRRETREFLSVIGSSGTGTARERLAELGAAEAESLIGRFGIGLLSAFLVAERVEVRTRKLGAKTGLLWQNQGAASCTLEACEVPGVGTQVKLFVAQEHAALLEEEALRAALLRHCDFIPFPIRLNGLGPVNSMSAPWHRPLWDSADKREAELRAFVDRRFPDLPLEVIPVDLPAPLSVRGALFITHNRVPDFNSAGTLDVYVRRMFVREADPDLLPPWAKFVRGIIDSPALEVNAARDNLRRGSAQLEQLREALGQLVLDRLALLAEREPERMARICKWHHFHLKGVALFNDEFFEKAGDLLFFESSRGPVCVRDVLRERRTLDPSGRVVVHTVSAAGAAAPYYKLAAERDWLVIDASKPIDEALLRRLAERFADRLTLVSLDGAEPADVFEPLAPEQAAELRPLEIAVERALRGAGLGAYLVSARRFALAELPALVLASPQTEAEEQLEAYADAPWVAPQIAALTKQVVRDRIRPLRLVLNARHALVWSLAAQLERGVLSEAACLGVALSALLHARKLITDKNAPIFHARLVALLAAAAAPEAQPLLSGFAKAVGSR